MKILGFIVLGMVIAISLPIIAVMAIDWWDKKDAEKSWR